MNQQDLKIFNSKALKKMKTSTLITKAIKAIYLYKTLIRINSKLNLNSRI